MNTLESNWSPLTSTLKETTLQTQADLFKTLENHCENTSSSKLEIGALLGDRNPVSKLIAEATLEQIINELDGRLKVMDMSDFVRLWSAFDNLKSTYHAALVVREASQIDASVIGAMLSEIKQLQGMAEGVDFDLLASGMRLMLDELIKDVDSLTAAEFAFTFLTRFVYRVMGQIEAPTNFWEILLLKLESRLLPSGLYPELSPLFTVFRILDSNLHNQPALFEFCLFSEEILDADKIAANIAGLAFAKAAPPQHRRELFMKLDAEFFYELEIVGDFSDQNAPWRTALHKRLERSFAELFIDAADGAIALRDQLTTLINESRQRDDVAKAIAADLSQGMAGKDVLNRIAENCKRVMNAAAAAHLLSANFIEAKELFIPVITAELGISPRAELWRKHSQLFSGLAQATAGMGSTLNWSEIGKLFTALDRRVTQMQGRPLNWMESPDLSLVVQAGVAKQNEWLAKLIRLVSIRIVIDERLYGSRWKQTITQWLVDQLFAPSQVLDEKSLEDLLIASFSDAKIAQREELTLETEHLKSIAQTFAGVVSRAAAAAALFRSSERIALGVSDDVLYALPQYAEQVGETGHISLRQDNQATLLKVSELLLASEEDPTEKLSEWWTSLIGSYLANRPESVFKENLAALYRNIGKHLSTVHTDTVFSPIHSMYNDSLSIRCIEAIASRPIQPIGPLVKTAPPGTSPIDSADDLREECATLKSILVEGAQAEKADALLNLFIQYHRALWLDGSADIAAARILPALNALDIDPALSELAGKFISALEGKPSIKRSDWLQQSAHEFAKLVYRSRIAGLLNEHSADISQYFAESMVAFAPEHFERFEHDVAVAKCSRDQTLLLRKIADFTRNSTPFLAWYDLTRYCLELRSAYVDYPDQIWALSFRTISKRLARHLSTAENLQFIRLMDQGESLAEVWSQTNALAKEFFDPTDYVFSAKADLDRHCRDLLTCVITASSMRHSGDFPSQSFLNRVFLSLELSVLDEAGLNEVIDLVKTNAGEQLTAQQSALLDKTKTDIVSLTAAYRSEKSGLNGLAKVDPLSRQLECLYTEETTAGETTYAAQNPVLGIFGRVDRMNRLENSPDDSRQTEFSAQLAFQLMQYFAVVDPKNNLESGDPNHLAQSGELLAGKTPSSLRDARANILVALLPKVQDAIKVLEASEEVAAQFLQELRSSEHSPDGEQHKEPTKEDFAYIFRTAAVASLLPTINAPSFFLGRVRDNRQSIKRSVAVNVYVRTALKVSHLLPCQPLAGFSIACDPVTVEGTLWKKVAFTSKAVPEKALQTVYAKLTELLDPAQSLDAAIFRSFSSYVGELCNSGDWQMAQDRCVQLIHLALNHVGYEAFAQRMQSLSGELEDPLGPANSAFWALHSGIIQECLRQVALGQELARLAKDAAQAYVATKYEDTTTAEAMQSYYHQRYILELVGASLSALGSSAAALNPVKFHVDQSIGYLQDGSPDLSQNWAFYEEWFTGKLSRALKPTLHLWFGRFMDSYGRSNRLAGFVEEALAPMSHELAEAFELKVEKVRDFLSGVCAAALLDVDTESSAVLGHTERIVLGSSLFDSLSEETFKKFLKAIEAGAETHASGKVPNLLKRVFVELPDILDRGLTASSSGGSGMARFYIANANDPTVPALWKASNLARCSLETNSLEAERNDALVARTIGEPLPEDSAIIKQLIAAKRARTTLSEAEITPPPKKKSLFGLISRASGAEVDWVNDRDMRTAAENVTGAIIRAKLLNQSINHYKLYSDSLVDSKNMEYAIAARELYDCLLNHLVSEMGDQHELTRALSAFIKDLSLSQSADRLVESGETGSLFFGLVCAKLRSADNGASFFRDTKPEAALEKIQSEKPELISEDAEALLKAAVAELKQSIL